MKFSFDRDIIFLGAIMIPLSVGLGILLTSVKSPSEIFGSEIQKKKTKIHKVSVKHETREEAPKAEAIKSLSENLIQPSSSLGDDLNTLSAGLVGEGSGGSGGMNVSQGDSQAVQLLDSGEDQNRQARAIQVVNPVYPQSAQARGIEGYVVLEIVISERGQVSEARVLSAEPPGLFDQVAIEAIRKWTFGPGLKDGKPTISKIKQKVNFELN